MNYLQLEPLPVFRSCAMRVFYPGEKHVTRICEESVMLFVFSGVLRFSENGEPKEIYAGEWYIQQAGIFQEGAIASEVPRYFYIHFQGSFGLNSNLGLPLTGHFLESELLPLLEQLNQCYNQPDDTPFLQNSLFLKVLSQLEQGNMKLPPEYRLAGQIAEYLSIHFTSSEEVRQLSRRFSYSQDHLIRIFRNRYQLTPYQYLKRLRINRAKHLLSSTDRSLEEIARECGYQDVSAFYRAFYSQENCSPGHWRKEQRNFILTGGKTGV